MVYNTNIPIPIYYLKSYSHFFDYNFLENKNSYRSHLSTGILQNLFFTKVVLLLFLHLYYQSQP
ncbi:hypothetical protein CBE01nite_39010 [Clostridium beijerinckii]|jgi:hypothetical protein|uniref:Uncharacterized protein n=1 Tax=Clostridium diolis TaxID=223919 RepID=A0AAV3VXE4_9CLOT|nr:hypothetical protein CDIOL_18510 [Clostridium diolis]GEP66133.1 hypothetical protein CBE01nite_39010 [Clostridium beijerinckii]